MYYAVKCLKEKLKEVKNQRAILIANSFPNIMENEIVKLDIYILQLENAIIKLSVTNNALFNASDYENIAIKRSKNQSFRSIAKEYGTCHKSIMRVMKHWKELKSKYVKES